MILMRDTSQMNGMSSMTKTVMGVQLNPYQNEEFCHMDKVQSILQDKKN